MITWHVWCCHYSDNSSLISTVIQQQQAESLFGTIMYMRSFCSCFHLIIRLLSLTFDIRQTLRLLVMLHKYVSDYHSGVRAWRVASGPAQSTQGTRRLDDTWDMMTCDDTWWNMMTDYDTCDHIWWHIMTHNIWWHMRSHIMILDVTWSHMIAHYDSNWTSRHWKVVLLHACSILWFVDPFIRAISSH